VHVQEALAGRLSELAGQFLQRALPPKGDGVKEAVEELLGVYVRHSATPILTMEDLIVHHLPSVVAQPPQPPQQRYDPPWHHQPPPATTSHHQPPPATTSHHQPPPATTSHHQPPPATTTHATWPTCHILLARTLTRGNGNGWRWPVVIMVQRRAGRQ
jgi:hypothetical protein